MAIPTRVRKTTLGALALWLGLWPAGDAITGVSNTMLDLSPPEAAAPACKVGVPAAAPDCGASPGCHRSCGGEPVAMACSQAPTPCGTGGERQADAEPPCASAKAARCGQCQCIGGLVLFAASPPQFGPDLELVGTLSASSVAGSSRCPRPLLRPPIADPSSIA